MLKKIYKHWRDVPQADLDEMYDQGVYASNMHAVLKSYAVASATARDLIGNPSRHAYGNSSVEMLDWFKGAAGGPINIFIHGGAWRSGDANQYHFPAPIFNKVGAHFVVLDFTNALETEGDLRPMVSQVQAAVAWVASHAATFGADAEKIFVSSHSSGSHIAACLARTDWKQSFSLPHDLIKGILYCGGIYELEPVFASSRRMYLKQVGTVIDDLSPIRKLAKPLSPAVVAYGELETPEFVRQSIEFSNALQSIGGQVTLLKGSNLNHFEILCTLGQEDGLLAKAALALMGLGNAQTSLTS